MATIRRRKRAAKPVAPPVTVEITEPFAVYWAGEQRTGTLDNVPLDIALGWLRRGWAAYYWGDAHCGVAEGSPLALLDKHPGQFGWPTCLSYRSCTTSHTR